MTKSSTAEMKPASISDATRQFVGTPRAMLIDGEWVQAMSGRTLPVFNPASGEQLAAVPAGATEDVDRAVAAATRI